MGASPQPRPSRRVFLLSQPRMTSNLLTRLLGLENQPDTYYDEDRSYPFVDLDHLDAVMQLQSKHSEEWTEDEKSQIRKGYQRCFDKLDQYLADGEAEGKIVFAKEHCNLLWRPDSSIDDRFSDEFLVSLPSRHRADNSLPRNPTVLPSTYLGIWKPIFLVRHPALAFASYYRAFSRLYESRHRAGLCRKAQDKYISSQLSFSFTRRLYDWYVEYATVKNDMSVAPVLLDADDYINNPELIGHLAHVLGLNESSVQYTWSPRRHHLANPHTEIWKRTVASSSCVRKDKVAGDLDIEEQSKKWRAEFGEKGAEILRGRVIDAMPDYEYLKSRRFC
ncbi:hypothetical protein BDV59DRAFT_202171 [Aspergillus ambiguus]|uniref:uncharacterized protein n=1 Tax=Aspergillus ambiguus TaxID=176160 RepID=UPI003CCC9799